MFLPTKPHSETIKNFAKEPTIRIGKHVPKDAVNMAYYFNPTATDAEKVLCAEAPRNTIDHRVEETYRYLFNMPSNDDDLFESAITWDDEEGYSGILPRVWVKWYEKVNVSEKSATGTKTVIVDNKSDVPTSMSYSDSDGYSGTLFLEAAEYEVKNVKTETLDNILKMNIDGYELVKKEVTSNQLDYYMTEAAWSPVLYVRETGIFDASGKRVGDNIYDGYTSPNGEPLTLINIEKDPVASYSDSIPSFSEEYGYITLYVKDLDSMEDNPFNQTSFITDAEIQSFISMMDTYETDGKTSAMGLKLKQWQTASAADRSSYGIEIHQTSQSIVSREVEGQTVINPETGEEEPAMKHYILAGYKMKAKNTSTEDTSSHNWYVYANYGGTLTRVEQKTNSYPISWEAKCKYSGIARNTWSTYDGVAYYRGGITKSDGIANINTDLEADILMFPDDEGFLRRADNGIDTITVKEDFYTIEAEQFYITDVFKDKTPCFYKYDLKQPIYDYRGPDDNGFYEGNAIKIYTSNLKDIPDSHKYQLKLFPMEYEKVTEIIDGETIETDKVKKYGVSVYTSFVSKTTNTYKATYSAFVDSDNVNSNNGVSEDIYNKPFMLNNVHYSIVPKEEIMRTNKIKITNPNIIEDTRRYVTFEYQVIAHKKDNGIEKIFVSNKRQAQILNKEYSVESEHDKFIDRAMIISPKNGEYYMSPYDIIIKDQAESSNAPIVTPSNAHEFIFYCKPVEDTLTSELFGAINIKCNPDGSGILTAETTLDTGFYNPATGLYTKKLSINNPYIVENGKIYAGYMVRCLDVRHIAIKSPREEHLLESWYPLIQFGHYSQVMDQYGAHTKVCYTMPEYDEQNWGQYGKPFVDVAREHAEVLNPHMIKVRNHPLYLRDDIDTVSIIRKKENEEFKIHIKDISFSEGIIITKEAISENDVILVDYTYLEEFYVYRGFYRNTMDFCRIDLNSNQYHTYSDLNKKPSELAPTKNLFNKTIYFYLRPTIRVRAKEVYEYETILDSTNNDLLTDVYNNSNLLMFNGGSEVTVFSGTDKTDRWSNINGTIQGITNDSCFYAFITGDAYKNYEHTVTMKAKESDDDVLVILVGAIPTNTGYDTLSLVCRLNTSQGHCSLPSGVQFALVYNYYQSSQKVLEVDNTFTNTGYWINSPNGITVKIIKDRDGNIKVYRTALNESSLDNIENALDTSTAVPVISTTLSNIKSRTGVEFSEVHVGYGNVSQSAATFEGIKLNVYSDNASLRYDWDVKKPIIQNEKTLYHTIDKFEPESNLDLYIGSVYIRQNTSLQSTVLIDTRTRGGGVLEEMKDSLRRQLEPESDFYLDIGCYDGTPYQENAVIIVRLDNRILKEYGGRFTQTDIEQKIKKWLGLGVYPIIEYVDSYSKFDMPQYNLIVENSYTNVVDQTPELSLECVTI